MHDVRELGVVDSAFHPVGGAQVAIFETDGCEDYWVLWSYESPYTPELHQFESFGPAREAFKATVEWWTANPDEDPINHV